MTGLVQSVQFIAGYGVFLSPCPGSIAPAAFPPKVVNGCTAHAPEYA